MDGKRRQLLCALAGVVLSAAGCSRAPVHAPEADKPALLARLYGTYISRHRGTPPKSAAELTKFADALAPDELKAIGIDKANLDGLFTSSRDHKPFVFRAPASYGGRPGPSTVVLHEQEGVKGKRIVVFSLGQTEEVDAARFKQLVPEAP
ncbi:MAG: hypothetical protein U0736_11145 [Gemmataceae bacterium]